MATEKTIKILRFADEMEPAESSFISQLEQGEATSRLISMGIRPQLSIRLIKRLFFGKTLIFEINESFRVALRKDEAHQIMIKSGV